MGIENKDGAPAGMAPVGVALVGCGRIAPLHLKGLVRLPDWVRLVAVVDPSEEAAQDCARTFGAARALTSLETALADPEVEAVILCTPNALHAGQALQALRAGKHVLVEKPFAESVEDAEAMAALADETGLVLAAGHTFRHVAAVRALQDRAAELGPLRAVAVTMCVHWDGPQAPWWATRTRGEGLILSLFAPHAIDFVQLVVGDVDPVRLHVEAARHQTGWLAEDEAMILMRYPGDVLASIHVSYNQPVTMNRKVIHFEKAVVRIENGDELWIDEKPVLIPERAPSSDEALFNDGITHYFETQLREFARAVRKLDHRSVLHPQALRQARLNRAVIEAARHD